MTLKIALKQRPSLVLAAIAVLALALLPILQGCGGKRTSHRNDGMGPNPPVVNQGPMGPEEPVGPLPDSDYTPPKDSFVLVLGPGMARALSYLGVLQEMEAKQLTINGIVGIEMGAVIGGIWASSNANTLEWEIHKFKRNTLLDFPLISFRRGNLAEGKTIYNFLGEALKVNDLNKMRMPFFVASSVRNESGLLLESNGSSQDIIRGAIGIPGILPPYNWGGKERLSAAVENPFPAERAKELGLGKVVCVNALGKGDDFTSRDNTEEHLAGLLRSSAVIARDQLKGCDYVITIPTAGIGPLNFDAKADLIYKGRMAVRSWLETLK